MRVLGRIEAALARYRLLLWAAGVVLLAVIALRAEDTRNVTTERDAARSYQRCEQTRATTKRLNAVIRETGVPVRLAPEVDCAAVYPRGAREALRFPDVAPTQP